MRFISLLLTIAVLSITDNGFGLGEVAEPKAK